MRVVVLVKHVPDVQGPRGFDDDGLLRRGGPGDTLNELDADALEAALRLAEARPEDRRPDDLTKGSPDPEVVALTVGPEPAVAALRRCLAAGATSAVRVGDDALAGSDALVTARVLAAAVAHLHVQRPVDLVVTGMAALDGLTSLVPAAVAAVLGWPHLSLVEEVTVEPAAVSVRRVTPGYVEVLRAPLPAVVSVSDQTFRPRPPDMRGLLAARTRPVTVLDLAALGVDPTSVGASGSSTTVLRVRPRSPRPEPVRLTWSGDGSQLVADLAGHLAERGHL